MKSFLRVLLLIALYTGGLRLSVQAQVRTVSGTVTDATGQRLAGVTVRVKGSSLGAVTDVNGKFRLEVPRADSLLSLSYVGYQEKEIPVPSGSGGLMITMQAGTGSLNEVDRKSVV